MARIILKGRALIQSCGGRVLNEDALNHLHRAPSRLRRIARKLGTNSSGKKGVRTRGEVDAAAAKRRKHEADLQHARWVTSWMAPWERAHMDGGGRPLQIWERVYWRLFVVLGGVGFVYETWVLGNRGVLKDEMKINPTNLYDNHLGLQQQQRWQRNCGPNGGDDSLDVATTVLTVDGLEED